MADVTLDDILADTTAERTEVDALATLTAGIKTQLDQALAGATLTPAQQAKVNAIFTNIENNKAAISAAILANTPSTTTPPATGGTGVTSVAVTSSVNPATVGAPVTLTAVVSQSTPASPVVVPTGTVQFLDNGAEIGTGTLDTTGTASLAVSTLASGPHSITAIYSGDGANATSTSSALTQTVA